MTTTVAPTPTRRTPRRYTRDDVETHGRGFYSHGNPAINVKAHDFPYVHNRDVQSAWGQKYTEAQITRALNFAFESLQETFWEGWHEVLEHPERDYDFFPQHTIRMDGEGRQGGWMIITGLPDLDNWDAIMLARWRHLERVVREDVAYNCKFSTVKDLVEANEWLDIPTPELT